MIDIRIYCCKMDAVIYSTIQVRLIEYPIFQRRKKNVCVTLTQDTPSIYYTEYAFGCPVQPLRSALVAAGIVTKRSSFTDFDSDLCHCHLIVIQNSIFKSILRNAVEIWIRQLLAFGLYEQPNDSHFYSISTLVNGQHNS